jgi:hypothetical protein
MPTLVAADKTAIYANVAIVDMPIGVYNYKIVKSYPDGRIETTVDTAALTGFDGNGIAVFAAGSTLANNPKFLANWNINEEHEDFEKGTYTYEFTFASVTRKYVVNVVDRPLLKLSSVSVGSTTTVLFGSSYTLIPSAHALDNEVVFNFTNQVLTGDNYVSATIAKTGTGVITINPAISGGATANSTAKVQLSALTDGKLLIGDVDTLLLSADKFTITLYFWRKVDHSVSANRYIQVGETQVVYITGLTPIQVP